MSDPPRPCLAVVVAVARNGCIGKDGGLPWHYPEDLKHFKRLTEGHAIVMGRATHESIGRPLPRRRNIVVTSHPDRIADGCETVASLDAALALAREHDDCPRVIGGARIFEAAWPRVTIAYLTEIDADVPGDCFFPALDRAGFHEADRRPADTPGLSFVRLERAS